MEDYGGREGGDKQEEKNIDRERRKRGIGRDERRREKT